MGWASLDPLHEAKAVGFPDAVHFKNKVVDGGVESRIGQYREDKVQEWRQRLAALIFATLK